MSEDLPVITHRLWTSFTPFEQWLYSLDSLALHLVHTFAPDVGDAVFDSWGLADFVQYGCELALRYDSLNRAAVTHWVRQEVWRRKHRQKRYTLVERVYDPLNVTPDVIPNRLPPEVSEWLDYHLPGDIADGLVLVAEQDWTLEEASAKLGIDQTVLNRSLRKLRRLVKEDRDVRD